MPETITLKYQLTKQLWQDFFTAHYSCDRSLQLRYLWGAICIVIACLGFGGYYASQPIAGLLLATGFFGVLSKHLLIYKSLRGACQHPFFGKELTLTMSPHQLTARSENSGYSQPWDNFIGYRYRDVGFLLYHDKNAFFFIPAAVLTAAKAKQIEQFLVAAEVPKAT